MSARLTKGQWTKGIAHWRDGNTAFLSVVFTWDLPKARKLAEYYRAIGCHVVAGGPGVFTQRKYLADVAEIPNPADPSSRIMGTIARHNPMATRASYGCPVGCFFCIVPKMDGKDFTLLPDFTPLPVLCDDNLSALPAEYQDHIVKRYRDTETPLLDANSGFEPRTFDDEVFARWKPILKGPWRFGFDEATEGDYTARAFRILKDVSPRNKQVYTMIGHEPFEVCMDRIQRVIASGGEPYAQPYIKLNALVKEPQIRHDWTPQKLTDVARWVNRHIWRKTPFAEYRGSTKSRRRSSDYDELGLAA